MENKMPFLWKINCRNLWKIVYHSQRFVKDGKIYKIEGTGLQSEQALKSGLSFQGKPIEFKLTDEWGWPIPEENLYKPYFGPRCLNCGIIDSWR